MDTLSEQLPDHLRSVPVRVRSGPDSCQQMDLVQIGSIDGLFSIRGYFDIHLEVSVSATQDNATSAFGKNFRSLASFRQTDRPNLQMSTKHAKVRLRKS